MNSNEMAGLVIKALEDKKAVDIRVINISEVSVIADYFIICNGLNKNQVQTLSDNVCEMLGKAGIVDKKTEGYDNANWILLDFKDVIIHIFDKDNRYFYDLERIWRDGKEISPEFLK